MRKPLLTLACLATLAAAQAQVQADFTALEAKTVYFSDDFDNGITQWDTTGVEGYTNGWRTIFALTTDVYPSYRAVNPTSTERLYCGGNTTRAASQTIKSPELAIREASRAEFYAYVDLDTLYRATFFAVTATDSMTLADFRADVEAGLTTPNTWRHYVVDLAALAGQTARIGFHFEGVGSSSRDISIEDLKVYQYQTPTAGAAIYIGDTVHFVNRSQGEGLSYAWTFEGGQPATSTEAEPAVAYDAPGTYAVTLTATATNGSHDTRTAEGFVTVGYNRPLASFVYPANVFFKRSSCAPMVPGTGKPVTLGCTTTNHPTYYFWEVTDSKGNLVATSNEPTCTVAFDTVPPGTSNAFYQYRLTVGNPAGETTVKSATQGIQVGGSSSIWNVETRFKPNTVTALTMTADGKAVGYYGGTNDAGVTRWAERFAAPLDTAYILQTNALFAKVGSYARGSKATLYICYEGDDGLPGDPIEGSEITLNTSQLITARTITSTGSWANKWAYDDKYPLLILPKPFYVVIEGLGAYGSGAYEVALDAVRRPDGDQTTVWMYKDGQWQPTPTPMTLLVSPWLGYSGDKLRAAIDDWKATGVAAPKADAPKADAPARYDLSGRRLQRPAPGTLYIERSADGTATKRVAR